MSKGIKVVVTFLLILLLVLFVIFFFSRKTNESSEKIKNIKTEIKKSDDSEKDDSTDVVDDQTDILDEEIEEDVNVVDTAVDDSSTNYVDIVDFDLIINTNKLRIASTTYLTTKVYPYNASSYRIDYSSSNNKVATVSKNGMVKGINIGECYITATANNGISKKIKISIIK